MCEDIDRACRKFVWGDNDFGRKLHVISWNAICSPRRNGGLGLRGTREVNLAFMMRANWRLRTNRSSAWPRIIRSKYGCGNEFIPNINAKKSGSNFWKGICTIWE